MFIPQSTSTRPKEARLLILNKHKSHETTQFILEYFKNNIYLLFLLPYTSHILQPLNLLIFSLLKKEYRYYLNTLDSLIDSISINKRNFLTYYQKARLKALTFRNITSE